jgi:Xaa-Pro dipeptidase
VTHAARRERLRELMDRLDLGALFLRGPANFAWYTDGADNRVDHASPVGVAGIVLTPDGEYVLADNIEAPRMREEQTPDMQVVEHPWYEGFAATLQDLTGAAATGGDFAAEDLRDVSAEIAPLRYALDDDAIARYRQLGRDTDAAFDDVQGALSPTTGETEAAASLAAACRERGMFSPVLMAAGERRMSRYRHPIPADEPVRGRVMLVVCAERGGLYANLTRIVGFEESDRETQRRQAACENVLNRMREATRPGRTLADLLGDCQRFYAEEGFPDGWRDHHQGGTTGYASRELVAAPDVHHTVEDRYAFAWNPSLIGAKAEETFLLLDGEPVPITHP